MRIALSSQTAIAAAGWMAQISAPMLLLLRWADLARQMRGG